MFRESISEYMENVLQRERDLTARVDSLERTINLIKNENLIRRAYILVACVSLILRRQRHGFIETPKASSLVILLMSIESLGTKGERTKDQDGKSV